MIKLETELWDKGINYIAGVDEVGRGPLAGPLVVSAVVLDKNKLLKIRREVIRNNDIGNQKNRLYTQINDSKLLQPRLRREIEQFLISEQITYSITIISPDKIDKWGISKSTQIAFFRSVKQLNIKPDHIITDMFRIRKIPKKYQTNIKKADTESITVAAASILAKVYRDNIMINAHNKYPLYGFDAHKGYGTKKHIEAIHKYGICDIHRKSFEPIKSILSGSL